VSTSSRLTATEICAIVAEKRRGNLGSTEKESRMGHVYRPTYTREIPPGAEPVRGKPAVRWKGRGGVWVYGTPCRGKPGRVLVESSKWRISYTDHEGVSRDVPGYTDRAATDAKLAELVKTSARISAGLLPPEASSPRHDLPELLDRWKAHLAAEGTAENAARQRRRAERVCKGVMAARPADLTPAKVRAWIATERKRNARFGGTTAGHHVGAVKAFTRWLCVSAKAEAVDHLSGLVRETGASDPRYVRRVLPVDVFCRLIVATESSQAVVRGLTGLERSVLYDTAASTGLRCSELASLQPSSFDLDAQTVTVEAAYSKRRRRDTLPLPDAMVPRLRALLAGRSGPVWPDRTGTSTAQWWRLGAEMLAADLTAAGIPVVVDGQVYDFHSLRSQFATDLDDAGVSLPRMQKLMRHSTPALTVRHYTRTSAEELASEVNKLRRNLG
jgi:integrase